jgi:hypothetical protein
MPEKVTLFESTEKPDVEVCPFPDFASLWIIREYANKRGPESQN